MYSNFHHPIVPLADDSKKSNGIPAPNSYDITVWCITVYYVFVFVFITFVCVYLIIFEFITFVFIMFVFVFITFVFIMFVFITFVFITFVFIAHVSVMIQANMEHVQHLDQITKEMSHLNYTLLATQLLVCCTYIMCGHFSD